MNFSSLTSPLGAIPGFSSVASATTGAVGAGAGSFAEALGGAIGQVESSAQSAKTAALDLLSGAKGDIASVALSSQRAELSLELFQQVRNKFVSAYQEIMKMPM
jgi:flagellar hook-basal body complex protein FliE